MNHIQFFIQFKKMHILRFLKLFLVNITNYKRPSGLWKFSNIYATMHMPQCICHMLFEDFVGTVRPLRQQLRRRKSRKYVDRC